MLHGRMAHGRGRAMAIRLMSIVRACHVEPTHVLVWFAARICVMQDGSWGDNLTLLDVLSRCPLAEALQELPLRRLCLTLLGHHSLLLWGALRRRLVLLVSRSCHNRLVHKREVRVYRCAQPIDRSRGSYADMSDIDFGGS